MWGSVSASLIHSATETRSSRSADQFRYSGQLARSRLLHFMRTTVGTSIKSASLNLPNRYGPPLTYRVSSRPAHRRRSDTHTYAHQSLIHISYAPLCFEHNN